MQRVLTDANVIIDAHKLYCWNELVTKFKILIPSIVYQNEVFHFQSAKGCKEPIILSKYLEKGCVEIIEANSAIGLISSKRGS